MKLPNSYGSVYKLSGKRRNPWAARKTVGWSDDAYKRLGELQFRINCLYPYIKETAVTGFLQTDIYQAFPDHDRAELSKAIDALYIKGSIQKTKKGNTYLITLAD